MGKSLLDDDFLDSGDDDLGGDDVGQASPSDKLVEKEEAPELEIDVVDDTPEKDKGKWVADDGKDGEPNLPNEEELRSYSKDVQKRFSQMTARIHAERRAREDRERQLNELATFAKKALEENNQLKSVLENGEKVLVGEHKGRLEASMAQVKRQLAEAVEAGDATGQASAYEQMAKLTAQMERLATHNPQPLPKADVEEFDKRWTSAPQPKIDPRAERWTRENPWFQRDPLMTSFAIGLHKQLVDNEGVLPTSEEYWTKIDSEMRHRFPEKFGKKDAEPRKERHVPVAGVSRGGGGSPKKVTLTESQVRLAKRLGLTPQQYAEQVVAESKSDGNMFTHGRS